MIVVDAKSITATKIVFAVAGRAAAWYAFSALTPSIWSSAGSWGYQFGSSLQHPVLMRGALRLKLTVLLHLLHSLVRSSCPYFFAQYRLQWHFPDNLCGMANRLPVCGSGIVRKRRIYYAGIQGCLIKIARPALPTFVVSELNTTTMILFCLFAVTPPSTHCFAYCEWKLRGESWDFNFEFGR